MNNQLNLGQMPNLQEMIYKMSKDMKFIGIITILSGALSCLTIIGAIIGIPNIIMGIRLKDSADHFQRYSELTNPADLEFAIFKQQSYFFIYKVLALIGIGLFLLMIIFYIVLFVFFFSRGVNFMDQFNDVAFNL